MIGRVHLPLFLLALAIAFTLKVVVSETEQLSEKNFEVKVIYNRPQGVMILDPVNEVEVRLLGRLADISRLNPIFIEVVAAVREGQLGTVEISLEASNVRTPRDAGNFQVMSVQPNRFSVEVEPVESARLPIRIEIVGEPAAGAVQDEAELTPAWAEVRGPASRIARLRSLTAGPVSVDRRAITFEVSAPVIVDDPLIEVQPSRILVRIPMQAPELTTPLAASRETNEETAP